MPETQVKQAPSPAAAAVQATAPAEKKPVWGVTLSAGLPYLMQLGVSRVKSPSLSYLFSGTYLPVPLSGTNTLYFFDAEAGLRYKPEPSDPFYVSAVAGFHSINYQATFNMSSLAPGTNLAGQPMVTGIDSIYLSPTVGWLWQMTSDFIFGVELGLEVPVVAWGGANIQTSDPGAAALATSLSQSSSPVLSHYSSLVIPRASIRVGWAF